MSKEKGEPLARETIEDWIESINSNQLPDWIQEHIKLYIESPEQGHLWDASEYGGYKDTPTILLTTKGRKSGKDVTLPLLYGKDGDNILIVGTKGGAPQHPGWYLNLNANPEVTVQCASDRFQALASTVTDTKERERLWKIMLEVYPPIESYQAATDRLIPVVTLKRS